jgi:hypothetical protein
VAWVCEWLDYRARSQAMMERLGWFVCKHARNGELLRKVSLGHVPEVLRS